MTVGHFGLWRSRRLIRHESVVAFFPGNLSIFRSCNVKHICTSLALAISKSDFSADLSYAHRDSDSSDFTCPYTLNKLISSSAKTADFDAGVQLHSIVIRLGFMSNVFICSALVDFYGKCLKIRDAQKLFDETPDRNAVCWNSLISGYLKVLNPERAVDLFMKMIRSGTTATPSGVSAILVGCAQLRDSKIGAQIHGLSMKNGFDLELIAGTSLIDMYAKSSEIGESRKAFDQMPERNLITWTTMVTGYAQNNLPDQALDLFIEMRRLDVEPNYQTYNSLLSSFSGANRLQICKQIHSQIIRGGLESNEYIQVTLVTVYAECGCSLEDFKQLCLNISNWRQISWNSVIAGFSQLESDGTALEYFSKMRIEGVPCDSFTFTTVLKSIGMLSDHDLGRQVHALALKTGCISNSLVQNALVAVYSRCGSLNEAETAFSSMSTRDVVSWNSLLSGLAHHGRGSKVLELFEEMKRSKIHPDENTFLSVISACAHSGLVEKGLEIFTSMESFKMEHYAAIVDLFARAGRFDEAEAFIEKMPVQPGPSVYRSLLSGGRSHGNVELSERASKKLLELYPKDPATYLLLSSSLATENCWNEAAEVRNAMQEKRVVKRPGCSWM